MTDNIEPIAEEQLANPISEENKVAPDDDMQKPVFNRIQVSDVVKREKQKAYEKGRKDALMEIQNQQMQQENGQPVEQQQSQVSLGGMQSFSPAELENLIAKKLAESIPNALQSHVHQLRTQQVVDSFVNKMQAAEAKYPGIQEQLNDLDYSTMAPVVEMANNMENTADIMKELLDNPEKLSTIMTLSYTQPKLAQRKIMDLSNSIKQNQEAKAQEAQAKEPMSQLKPSFSAGMDNGAMSVTDFRKLFR